MAARLAPVYVIAALALVLPAAASAQSPQLPDEDPFYAQPTTQELETKAPGELIRSRVVKITGFGIELPYSGWQVFYRSNDSKHRPIAAMATVLLPLTPWPGPGKRPLVSYQMATDSLGTQCNPSYRMRTGQEKEEPVVANLLEMGWAVVVPDYEGPRMAWGAGPIAAHTVLDGLRAATHFEPAGLGADTPIGMWGYSGGGQATAWATEQQPAYAPELNVAGVAQGGVPADIEQVARAIDGTIYFGILLGAAVGIEREYPEMDLNSLLNAEGKSLKSQVSNQCAEQLIGGYPNRRLSEISTVPDPLVVPQIRDVLESDKLGKATPTAPVYMYHSIFDQLIPVAGPDALAAKYCDEGAQLVYQRDVAGEHIAYAFTGGGGAIAYLAERFAGGPVPTNCDIPTTPGAR